MSRALLICILCGLAGAQSVHPELLNLIGWRSIGPSRGGRVLAVSGDPANKFVHFMGATGGGVWKTDDGGITWRNVSDGYFRTGSVGAIAVAPSNSAVVYVGMGESCFRGDTSHGDGVYRSPDGGRTWNHLGLEATRHISRIRVHPSDPDTLWVAAFGDGFGPSADRGIYKSTNGGKTWKKTLYRNDLAGAIDLVLDPHNPKVLYASLLEFRRMPWAIRSGGDSTSLWKSVDGGESWVDLTGNPGIPAGPKGRIGIAASPAKQGRLWAIIDAATGQKGVFRSDDAGANWARVSDNAQLTQRPWYYHHIFADTKDADTIYVLNIGMWKSVDGGVSYSAVSPPHGDHHDLWIDSNDPQHMVEGNDGGATVTYNGGRSWSSIYNQPTAQMYHAITDRQFPYRVYGAQQDNSSISLPARSDFGSITAQEWWSPANSESGYIAVNQRDPNVLYVGDHHWLYRYDNKSHQTRDISPNPETHYGWGARDINFRFQWTFPVMTSPHDPSVVYTASQYVHKSTDEGHSWTVISPDLTRHDPDKLEPTPSHRAPQLGKDWGPITRDNTGVEWYSTVFAFAESPVQKDLLWAGSDDGFVQLSRDGGKSWKNVTPKGLPEFALISIVEPSPHDAAVAYLAATRYKLQDRRPFLFKTTDFGETWTQITSGVPDGDFTRVIRCDPGRKGILFAGTETGVYFSVNDGSKWNRLQMNLPVVPIHDLIVQQDPKNFAYDLIAATHGRGFWVLDDVNLLHQMIDVDPAKPVVALEPNPSVRFRIDSGTAMRGEGGPASNATDGRNPPRGVAFKYFLKVQPKGPVTITIADARGQIVRTYSSQQAAEATAGRRGGAIISRVTARAGANEFVWNMQYPPARVTAGTTLHGAPFAPLAASGEYTAKLAVDGVETPVKFRISTDPRVTFSEGQLLEQFSFLVALRDLLSETHEVVRKIRATRKEAEDWVASAGAGNTQERDRRAARLAALNESLYPLEERLTQYRARATQDLSNFPSGIDNKINTLATLASKGEGPPTRGALNLFRELSRQVAEKRAEVDAVLKSWGEGKR